MAVANFFKLIVLVMIPAVLAGVVTLIYLPAYNKKINARLNNFVGSDIKADKPVTPPLKVFLTAFLALFFALILVIAILITMYKANTRSSSTVDLGSVDQPYFFMRQVVTESLLDAYTPGGEIPGYRLTSSKQENGFEIYFYAGNDGEFGGFPEGLIGIRNTNDELFYMDVKAEQHGAIFPDYEGSFSAYSVESPVMWCTAGTFNFYGTLDIRLETMSAPENTDEYSLDELRALSTGKTAEMHLELDKELGIEGWYDKQ